MPPAQDGHFHVQFGLVSDAELDRLGWLLRVPSARAGEARAVDPADPDAWFPLP